KPVTTFPGHALDPMHGLEDFFALNLDLHAQVRAFACQVIGKRLERDRGGGEFHHHDHGEELADHRLADVENIDVRLRNRVGGPGDDAEPVGADDGHDGSAGEGGSLRGWRTTGGADGL